MSCIIENNYSTIKTSRKLPSYILQKLLEDDELFILMKYEKPYNKKITMEEKKAMICETSINEDYYNVVPQRFTETALTTNSGKVFSQLRFEVLGGTFRTNQNNSMTIVFQSIVLNKMKTCTTNYTLYDNRAMAILQRVIEVLNGNPLEEYGNYLFLNSSAQKGSGFTSVNFNKEYSGYQIVFSANMVD